MISALFPHCDGYDEDVQTIVAQTFLQKVSLEYVGKHTDKTIQLYLPICLPDSSSLIPSFLLFHLLASHDIEMDIAWQLPNVHCTKSFLCCLGHILNSLWKSDDIHI